MLRASDGDRFVWTFPICDVAAGRMSDDNISCQHQSAHISYFGLGNYDLLLPCVILLPFCVLLIWR